MIAKLFIIIIGAIFVNNFVLSRFLGICPYLGVSKQWESAMGMGLAVIFVMTMASFITWIIFYVILKPFAEFGSVAVLQTISFILTIAALVQVVEMIMRKTAPALYKALGIYLPLITTNCAVLGVTLLNIKDNFNLLETLVHGFAAGVGFTLALLLMAGIRERLEFAKLPKAVQGFAVAFIIASLMSLSFLGFSGLISE